MPKKEAFWFRLDFLATPMSKMAHHFPVIPLSAIIGNVWRTKWKRRRASPGQFIMQTESNEKLLWPVQCLLVPQNTFTCALNMRSPFTTTHSSPPSCRVLPSLPIHYSLLVRCNSLTRGRTALEWLSPDVESKDHDADDNLHWAWR